MHEKTDRGERAKPLLTSNRSPKFPHTPHGFQAVEEHTYIQDNPGTQRSNKSNELDNIAISTTSNSKGFRCISALLKLSMSKESHEQIIEPDNMNVIMIYLEKLSFYIRKIPHVWDAPTLQQD